MYKNFETKTKVLLFISIILLAFVTILVGNIYYGEKDNLSKEQLQFSKNTTIAYSNSLKNYEMFYKTRLTGLLHTENIINAVEQKDRKLLYLLVKDKWDLLKKENSDLKIMHFHLPNGKTLLRMHKPSKFDDDIAKKRAMARYMHKNQKYIASFEAGINLLGYRVMIPIFKDKKYLGALEIGSKPNFVLNSMKKSHNITGVIFAKQAEIFDKKLIDKNKLIINNYRLDSDTLDDKDLIKKIPKDYKLDKDFIIKKDDKTYAVYLFEHKDFNGDISAKTLIFNDITDIINHFYEAIYKIILFASILYILSIFIVKFGFEKMLIKIDSTTKELSKNIAFLKSHQLAMDESSIVSKADLKGNITYVNNNFCKVSGYTKDELIGKPHNILRHPSNSEDIFKDLWSTIKNKKVWSSILQNRGKTQDYWVDISILPILDENNNIVEYIAIRHDVTKMVKQKEALDSIANTDILTGYGNRYKLNNDINSSINPALAILNIDDFSQLNDFYGHEKGDFIIKCLGENINNILKNQTCKLYHLQGDEYVVFNKDIEKDIFIKNIDDILLKVSDIPIKIEDDEMTLNLTTSLSFETKDKILTTADMALKVAKRENKEIVIYNDNISLNNEYQNNIKWAKKIKYALEWDNFTPVFQPIVNNHNGIWEKYECLVRMEDEDKLISPYFFLDISKKTKHYTEITRIMLEKSFEIFKDKDLEFSVNLTIEDILNEDIKSYIFSMLESYGIGSRVVFEIVESESIENFEQIALFIEKIKSYGCKIAIDDFGTGYSNFEYLMKLKADYIKIDGSMIKDIDKNKDAQLVVTTIVDFARKMGMKTIGEFIENESIQNKVKELGIDYSQGYYFSKPELTIKDN
ncbi:MAG: EAL domain-containing protein [Campylobacterota bacterium]|nr:EAL domain-containing protein [Campylobacterota bacterium]